MFKNLCLTLCATLALIGCGGNEAPHSAGLTYTKDTPLSLNVASAHVEPLPVGSGSAEEIILQKAAETWGRSRFMSNGTSNRLRVTFTEASLKVTTLPAEPGLFKAGVRDEYRGKLNAAVEIIDDRGFPISRVRADAMRTITVPERTTLAQREAELDRLRDELINALDQNIVMEMRENMTAHMVQ